MTNKNCRIEHYDRTTVCWIWDEDSQREFKGVAVCQPSDKFDGKIGEKIARLKAVLKMQTWKANTCESILQQIEHMKQLEPTVKEQQEYWTKRAGNVLAILNDVLSKC